MRAKTGLEGGQRRARGRQPAVAKVLRARARWGVKRRGLAEAAGRMVPHPGRGRAGVAADWAPPRGRLPAGPVGRGCS